MFKIIFAVLLSLVLVNPALAAAQRPNAPSNQPVSRADVDAWNAWTRPVLTAISTKRPYKSVNYQDFSLANTSANTAIMNHNNPVFQVEQARARAAADLLCVEIGGC